ncbi:MAG: hypothetical protein IJ161_10760 [Bacteroidales bacterium]|nr:hypothetical protein [Bacteroidales bacterium]
MEEKMMNKVCDFLLKEGTTWDSLKKSEQRLIEKVMPEIERRMAMQDEAHRILKENAINQSSIGTALGITRKTLGSNNPIVGRVIDAFAGGESRAVSSGSVPAERFANLQAEVKETRERLDKVLDQEVIAEELKVELHRAQETISERDKMIDNYSKENTELRRELDSYRRQGLSADKSSAEAISMLGAMTKASGNMKN